jgi:glutamate synthase (ferredoxin)
MVDLVELTKEDKAELKGLVEKHKSYTDSALATRLLANWQSEIKHFIKVFPTDYRIALERIEKEKELAQKTA